MTQAEKNTLGDLVTVLTQAEIELTQVQEQLSRAMKTRDTARREYYNFLQSIQPSDVPAPPTRKRRIDAGVKRNHPEGCICVKCDPRPNHAPALGLLHTAHNAAEDTQR